MRRKGKSLHISSLLLSLSLSFSLLLPAHTAHRHKRVNAGLQRRASTSFPLTRTEPMPLMVRHVVIKRPVPVPPYRLTDLPTMLVRCVGGHSRES